MATRYTMRVSGPEILQKGITNTLTCPVALGGSIVLPSSGSISIYNAANEAVVSGGAITFPSNIPTYSLSAPTVADESISDTWRVEWTLVISGETCIFRRDASLVYRRLYPTVDQSHLVKRHTDLSRRLTVAQIQDKVDEAWGELEGRLLASGKRPWLILAPSALALPHTYQSLALCFRDLGEGNPESNDTRLAEKYENLYNEEWGKVTFPQADPTTGHHTDGKRKAAAGSVWLTGRS